MIDTLSQFAHCPPSSRPAAGTHQNPSAQRYYPAKLRRIEVSSTQRKDIQRRDNNGGDGWA